MGCNVYDSKLYQIGIRCLAATEAAVSFARFSLYQIGIRCLAATGFMKRLRRRELYQIGIRCLAATITDDDFVLIYYIKLELDV